MNIKKILSIGLISASFFAMVGCTDGQTSSTDQSAQNNSSPNTQTMSVDQLAPPKAGDTIAILDTDYGTIKFKLFTDLVPEMTKNFIELSNAGKYTDVPFHRVIKNFMIQTGDFDKKNGMGGYSYKGPGTVLPDEITPQLSHLYGTVSMANRGPDTNGSQFFIITNKDGYAPLNGGYTIFGQVFDGMDVAEKIANLYDPSSGDMGKPTKIINIKTVTIEQIPASEDTQQTAQQ